MAYADENYDGKKELYDSIAQCFENYKYGTVNTASSWNSPVTKIRGITMRLNGNKELLLTYHRYEVTTVEGLERLRHEDTGIEFVAEVAKALKKEFKSLTGKALTLKRIDESPINFEKASRLSAESSWMLGSSRYGHGARPVGRYLVRTTCVYEFSADL
jgi:hypothetical protein